MRRSLIFTSVLLLLLAAGLLPGLTRAWSNGALAALVLGQVDFTSSAVATSQSGLYAPLGVAVDPTSGKVFVADSANNRVLRFASLAALNNGAAAEAVLGQPDFTSNASATSQSGMRGPWNLTVDSSGQLWVADSQNSRVLRFDNAATKANGANADGVLGQPDFVSSNTPNPPPPSRMSWPTDVSTHSRGGLWVGGRF
jgi:hypothetical protein